MRKRLVALVALVGIVAMMGCGYYTAGVARAAARYTDAASVSVSLNISGGKASCSGQIKPNASNKKAKVTIKLQKKTGSSWTTMQTWSKTATGLAGAKASGTRAVTAGLTYRVYLTGYVYDSNGNVLESITKASASKVA